MKAIGRWATSLLWGSVIWLVVVAFILVEFWPMRPRSAVAWVFLVALGPPLYLIAELLGERFWSSEMGRSVSHHPSRGMRILLGVAFGALWLGLVFAFTVAIGESGIP